MSDRLYSIPADERNPAALRRHLREHPEIRFVSLTGVDLGGNDTDERIPVPRFLASIDEYLSGGVETDGSSVVLPGIATLNDGKVDLIPDASVSWRVDYNLEFPDPDLQVPVGTLRIPSFLRHGSRFVDSRSILQRAVESASRRLLDLLRRHPKAARASDIDPARVRAIELYGATELEFWVRTPRSTVATEKLAASQILQESYWKRTKGAVRSALEHSLLLLEKYGLEPEMGHKEVGGVKATLTGQGGFDDILEQLEVDWKYASALQAADNELFARILIKETFRRHGLEVTFLAKPIDGVAGSGEHTHVSIMAVLDDGSRRNLFAPRDTSAEFLSPIGWGALMGLLRNYEAAGPFVTASNDAFNRLKPGFEAPVCVVASVGHDVALPSRNRTVLAGLIRDLRNPLSTRFEIRAPNPHTNTFLALAAFYQTMLDGMAWACKSGRTAAQLQADFSKPAGQAHPYLERSRAYRSEEDVFEGLGIETRGGEKGVPAFGAPPATVWETVENLDRFPKKARTLLEDGVFSQDLLESYKQAVLLRWTTELCDRIIPESARVLAACVRLPGENELDAERWERVRTLKEELGKDSPGRKSIFTSIREAVAARSHADVSRLQLEMSRRMVELVGLYRLYRRNAELG